MRETMGLLVHVWRYFACKNHPLDAATGSAEMTYIHIQAPRGEYIAQIRLRGHKLWENVGKRRNARSAMIADINKMGPDHKRARVLFCAEWYDPVIVMELNK